MALPGPHRSLNVAAQQSEDDDDDNKHPEWNGFEEDLPTKKKRKWPDEGPMMWRRDPKRLKDFYEATKDDDNKQAFETLSNNKKKEWSIKCTRASREARRVALINALVTPEPASSATVSNGVASVRGASSHPLPPVTSIESPVGEDERDYDFPDLRDIQPKRKDSAAEGQPPPKNPRITRALTPPPVRREVSNSSSPIFVWSSPQKKDERVNSNRASLTKSSTSSQALSVSSESNRKWRPMYL